MRKQVIVIVGRPNVGKSTLFNRLTGRRDAIVDDMSGVTRDRNYGEVEWNAKSFVLIDTGGFVPDSDDLFETEIREQVKMGIEEADKIIFLVDAKDGVNPFDRQIATMVRNSGKPFFLVVNKVDTDKQEMLTHEFYELGLGDPYSLAAAVGRKIGDFLDLISDDIPVDTGEETDSRLKIAILGRPNVGKSSLTNALLGFDRSMVTNIPGTTRDSLDSVLKYYGEEIVLVDTAGLRKRTKVKESIEFFSSVRTLSALQNCDIAIIMLDSVLGLEKQDQKIIDEAVSRKKGIILAMNKWDLIEKDDKTAAVFEKGLREKLGRNSHFPIIFISALTKQRIFKVIELAKEVEARRKAKIPTSHLNDTILEDIAKTPPPTTATGREVKIKYITQGGEHYPVFIFFSNYPNSISESYKRFLENMLREHYDYDGVPLTLVFKEK
jgi:GTP-binding protein